MLQIRADSEVVLIKRLRLVDDEPCVLQAAYLPSDLCPNILKQDFAKDSLYTVLSDEYGLVPVRANNSFEARLADADEREDLLPHPSAVLVMRQTSYLKNSRPVEYTRSVYKGNQRFESIHGSLVSSQQDV